MALGRGPACLDWLAQIYVQVGENGQAIDALRRLLASPVSGGAISPALLKLDPVWDPLRGEENFQKLIAEGEAAMKAAGNP
jgi:serine/threonine-protein kinase